jgi:DNA-binding MarR family transcriptional regulator
MSKKIPKEITKEEQAFHQMNDVVMQISKIYIRQHNKMQDFGIGSSLCRAEIHTIQAIGNNEGINLTELAAILKVSKPTISERIKKLIKHKLVQKQLKDGNDKEVMLSLTKQGWITFQNHEKQHKEIYKLFKKHFGNEASDFLNSLSNELCLFLEFINDVRKNTKYFQ